jgi:hypothetical protein
MARAAFPGPKVDDLSHPTMQESNGHALYWLGKGETAMGSSFYTQFLPFLRQFDNLLVFVFGLTTNLTWIHGKNTP